MKKYHYVYEILEITTGRKYIGVRSSEVIPSEDLGINYFSSSSDSEFILAQKANPKGYSYRILSEFSNRKEANEEEIRLHRAYNVGPNDIYINRITQINGFDPTGYMCAKDLDGNYLFVSVDDPRFKSGELVGHTKSTVSVKDQNDNVFRVDKDDPRYLSGELVGHTKGKATFYDVENKCHVLLDKDTDSPRYKWMFEGQIVVKDKDGNKFRVDKNDPRFVSGELVGHSKGRFVVKDKDGNKSMIDKDDPRYISGELIHINVGKVPSNKNKICINNGIKNRYISKDEQIPEGWKTGGKPKQK